MSQEQLARCVDLNFQQIQKYESGANRVSASRLFQVAEVFGVDPAEFFRGLGDNERTADRQSQSDLMFNREAIELVSTYYKIPEASRRAFFSLVASIANAAGHD